jgi:hypothetical protein
LTHWFDCGRLLERTLPLIRQQLRKPLPPLLSLPPFLRRHHVIRQLLAGQEPPGAVALEVADDFGFKLKLFAGAAEGALGEVTLVAGVASWRPDVTFERDPFPVPLVASSDFANSFGERAWCRGLRFAAAGAIIPQAIDLDDSLEAPFR